MSEPWVVTKNETVALETGKGYKISVKYNEKNDEFDLHLVFPDTKFYLVSVSDETPQRAFTEAKSLAITWLQLMRRVAAQEIRQMEESARQYAEQLDSIDHLEEQMEAWDHSVFRSGQEDDE